MVAALNRMLDRLAAAVAQMQRFTADAAHELRTPLAVLRAGLEVALRRDAQPPRVPRRAADALQDSERLDRLAEDLLTLARLEALPPRARRDADQSRRDAARARRRLERLAERRGVRRRRRRRPAARACAARPPTSTACSAT